MLTGPRVAQHLRELAAFWLRLRSVPRGREGFQAGYLLSYSKSHGVCGSLSENAPSWLIYLNVLFRASGTTWEGWRGVALLAEVCHWRWSLRLQRLTPGSVTLSACHHGSMCNLSATAPAPFLSAGCHASHNDSHELNPLKLSKPLLKSFILYKFLSHSVLWNNALVHCQDMSFKLV